MNDAMDSALDDEDIEEEIDEEVDKVLTALAGETAAQLPEAVRKEKVKQTVQTPAEVIYIPKTTIHGMFSMFSKIHKMFLSFRMLL